MIGGIFLPPCGGRWTRGARPDEGSGALAPLHRAPDGADPSSGASRHLLPQREKGCSGVPMLEGLPPNNAAHRLTLVTDEKRARAVADLIVESFEPAEVASTAFETEDALAGRRQGLAGGGLFRLRAGRGGDPRADRRRVRRGDGAFGDLRPHREARLGRQCAGRPRAGARRALSRSRRARSRARADE